MLILYSSTQQTFFVAILYNSTHHNVKAVWYLECLAHSGVIVGLICSTSDLSVREVTEVWWVKEKARRTAFMKNLPWNHLVWASLLASVRQHNVNTAFVWWTCFVVRALCYIINRRSILILCEQLCNILKRLQGHTKTEESDRMTWRHTKLTKRQSS